MNRELTSDESSAFSRMLKTVRQKANRNRLRDDYVEAKKKLEKIGFSIPENMKDFQNVIGWAHKAVKVPASRIRPDGFILPNGSSMLDDLHDTVDGHVAVLERMAIEASLQNSAAFVFTTPGDPDLGEPDVVVTARTALEATAEIDPRTWRVTAALEVVSQSVVLLYKPGMTLQVERADGGWRVTRESNGIPDKVPCVPYVWGRSLKRPFGRSRVTRPLMGYIDSGVRTMLRQEVTAEFYSAPQRALLGADESHFTDAQGNRISPLKALLGGIWALPDVWDEDEGKLVRPSIQQLAQASMQPHSEMLRTIGLMVSSETTIPVGYLGIIHDNPSSADAILASESDLVAMVEDELASINLSRVDLARNILAVKNGEWTPAMERDLRGLKSRFLDPGTPTMAAKADAGVKFAGAFPDGDPEVAMEIYGLDRSQIERMNIYRAKQAAGSRLDTLLAAAKSSAAPVFSDGSTVSGPVDEQLKSAQVMKAQADALGSLRRAGVDAADAAAKAGLNGVKFIPGNPITIREGA
ncbi:phage portal protein [Arthrobacter terricola]|uniref:Phage portal protein n=2 Tax=Arthrobacter TaxID=1663 RepID=A0A4R5KAH7_9MICC|nr:phage portal protein [Arthrobacter terricola]